MKYTVLWKPDAERKLGDLWVDAVDKKVITDVANRIDQELSTDAHLKGESRGEIDRVLLIAPMGVYFQANEADRVVLVLTVWLF